MKALGTEGMRNRFMEELGVAASCTVSPAALMMAERVFAQATGKSHQKHSSAGAGCPWFILGEKGRWSVTKQALWFCENRYPVCLAAHCRRVASPASRLWDRDFTQEVCWESLWDPALFESEGSKTG